MSMLVEPLVSGIIEKVVEMGFEYLKDQCEWQSGMKTELRRLRTQLPQISAVVKAAESGDEQQIKMSEPLKKWLWQLKDAVYDADDVLDDFEYLRVQKQVEVVEDRRRRRRQVFGCLSLSHSRRRLTEIGKRALKSDPVLKNLREVVRKLDEVAAGVGIFVNLISLTHQQQQHHHQQQQQQRIEQDNRETTSSPTQSRLLGREEEMEELVVRLLMMMESCADDSRKENVSLVSIVGHGGMGKTTLAQHIYNDKRIADHFDLKIWVCVSNSFDIKGLTRNMLEGVTERRPDVDSLNALQEQLKKKLMDSKRFLLVLDDAWNDTNSSDWGKLFAPLKHGSTGSKILLTTRMNTVAEMADKELMGAAMNTVINLKGLAEHDQLLLFNEHAFAGVKDPNNYKKMQSIGKKIAGKLGDSPLTAKVVGDMLNSNVNEEYWEKVLHNDISQFEEGEKGIMSALKLSYHHLPEHLRPCFAYCSIFHPDYKFSKNDLIYMWMAMGFIQQSSGVPREMSEDIGSRYFDYLVRRSFFEPDPESDPDEQRYVVHDLLHEMAGFVSRDECLRFLGDASSQEILGTIRHLSFINTSPELLAKVHNQENWPKLRTLHLVYGKIGEEHIEFLKKILAASKGVRVLTVSAPVMKELRDAIGVLTHLKYLRIFQPDDFNLRFSFIRLPDSLCKMYNLQAINLAEPSYGRKFDLPPEMNNAINLRHLIPEIITEEIAGVRKLTCLMELVFTVKEDTGDNKIGELKDLNQLRRLKIEGLENVKSRDEAIEAELHCKEHLKQLTLEWSTSRNNGRSYDSVIELDEQVLECLRPGSKINKLTIKGYMGAKSANWMESQSVENLENVQIERCSEWEQILTLKKSPYLRYLYLRDMPAVKRVDLEGCFQQLEVLEITTLKNWEESCCSESAGATDGEQVPHLRKLMIRKCPKLKVLPALPSSLEKIVLNGVGLTAFPKLCCSTTRISSSSSSLHFLSIVNCNELVDLPAKGFRHLCSLKRLQIANCPKLLPQFTYNHNSTDNDDADDSFLPTSLQELTISNCGDLDRSLPRILHGAGSLSELYLIRCNNMISLPPSDVMRSLTSLDTLAISGCEELTSLEGLTGVCHLYSLVIEGCSKLVTAAEAQGAKESTIKEKNKEEEDDKDLTFSVTSLRIDGLSLLRLEPLRRLKSVIECTIKWNCSSEKEMVEPWLHHNRYTLEVLRIHDFSFPSLPASLKDLSSLKELRLFDAHDLQSLPQLPPSLRFLVIDSYSNTLKKRCKEDTGADWPKIKHIPRRIIF